MSIDPRELTLHWQTTHWWRISWIRFGWQCNYSWISVWMNIQFHSFLKFCFKVKCILLTSTVTYTKIKYEPFNILLVLYLFFIVRMNRIDKLNIISVVLHHTVIVSCSLTGKLWIHVPLCFMLCIFWNLC